MFNPMAILTPELLQAFVQKGHRFFVRQHYPRGRAAFDTATKAAFLICPYDNYFLAKEHFDALSTDPYRYLYHWEEVADRGKLEVAAAQPAGYRVYGNAFVDNWEQHLTDRLRGKIRAYVKSLGWKPKGGESVEPVFYPHFGEVFVRLKLGSREVRVNFEEIEKSA